MKILFIITLLFITNIAQAGYTNEACKELKRINKENGLIANKCDILTTCQITYESGYKFDNCIWGK